MDYSKIAKSYTAQAIETASPGKLVLMLFDGALRFMTAAREGFKDEDFMKRNEAINNNLIKAQNIVAELQSSLDMNVSGELPGTLYKLYDFVYYQLQQANLKKKSSPSITLKRQSKNCVTLGLRCLHRRMKQTFRLVPSPLKA